MAPQHTDPSALTFKLRRDEKGLWWLTREDERTLCVCHRSLDKLLRDVPAILRKQIKLKS